MISDERFFAWLDGELDEVDAAAIGALVAANPELQRRADAHRALAGRIRAAFEPIAEAPVPDRLRGENVVSLPRPQAGARPTWRPMQWAAMAATLVIGVVAGTMIDSGGSGPVTREDGQLVAAGDLEQSLYTRLASAPADDGPRIGLTFHDATGDLCRSFRDGSTSGLACHQDGAWRIQGLFQGGEGQDGEFRMAAGADPRLAQLIDSAMAGQPLDAAGERKALDGLR